MYRTSYEGFPRDYWAYLHTPSDEAYGLVNDASTMAVQSMPVPADTYYNYLYNQPVDPRLAGNLGGPWGGKSSFATRASVASATPIHSGGSTYPLADSMKGVEMDDADDHSSVNLEDIPFEMTEYPQDPPVELPELPQDDQQRPPLALEVANSLARQDPQSAAAAISQRKNIAVGTVPADTINDRRQRYPVRRGHMDDDPLTMSFGDNVLNRQLDTIQANKNAETRKAEMAQAKAGVAKRNREAGGPQSRPAMPQDVTKKNIEIDPVVKARAEHRAALKARIAQLAEEKGWRSNHPAFM